LQRPAGRKKSSFSAVEALQPVEQATHRDFGFYRSRSRKFGPRNRCPSANMVSKHIS
jgi:hypothetical protein